MSNFNTAQTFNILTYTNTWGDFLSLTNALVQQNNDLASNNFTKASGTLVLTDPTLALQVNTASIFQGSVQIVGTGSSATIQNNMNVAGQVYFTNPTLGLTNYGQANIGGPLLALASNTGLYVANTANIAGRLNVTGNASAYFSNSVFVSNNLTTNKLTANTSNTTTTFTTTLYVGTGGISTLGPFIINDTVYNNPNIVLSANSANPPTFLNPGVQVNRGLGLNGQLRWNETNLYWDTRDVTSGNYYRLLSDEYLSDSLLLASSSNVATSMAVYTLYNTLGNYTISAYNRANTSVNAITGTNSFTVAPNNGAISYNSTNGVTVAGSSNTFTINTPQDLRSSASPSFNALTLTNALAIAQGGTGATSSAAALNNLLPSGQVAGYTLVTGGVGTYYWAPGGTGGGSGAVPGTTIQSTRNFPTVNNNQTVFTTPTYIPGASQIRPYINGVRQFPSEYTESSNTSITFNTGLVTNDILMFEVDGYIINPYYANNIPFTAPFGSIVAAANTIQLAIQDQESRKATILSPTFTGIAAAPTPSIGTSNTQIATTAYVQTALLSGNTYTININGIASTLNTTGNYQVSTIGIGAAPDTANTGSIRATGQIVAYYSDENLKIKLGNIENALDKVNSLNGFYYEPNEIAQSLGYAVKREVGVSAQEVQKILPEIVVPAPIDDKYLTVHYERLVPLLIEAIKELKSEVDELKGKLNDN